jgi:hypothetical protein
MQYDEDEPHYAYCGTRARTYEIFRMFIELVNIVVSSITIKILEYI